MRTKTTMSLRVWLELADAYALSEYGTRLLDAGDPMKSAYDVAEAGRANDDGIRPQTFVDRFMTDAGVARRVPACAELVKLERQRVTIQEARAELKKIRHLYGITTKLHALAEAAQAVLDAWEQGSPDIDEETAEAELRVLTGTYPGAVLPSFYEVVHALAGWAGDAEKRAEQVLSE